MSEILIHMPDVGPDGARLLQWRVRAGDRVHEDDTLLCLGIGDESAEITSPSDGLVTETLGDVGVIVRPGEVLVRLDPASRPANDPAPEPLGAAAATLDMDSVPPPRSSSFAPPGLFASLPEPALRAELAEVAGLEAADRRFERARALFEETLAPAWNHLAAAADQYMELVDREESACCKTAAREHELRLSAIEERLRSGGATREGRLTEQRRLLASEQAQAMGVVRAAWAKVGAGRGLPDPETVLIRQRDEELARGGGLRGDLARLQQQANALLHVPLILQDEWITRYTWWTALGVGALGWLMSQNFTVGFYMGLASGIGMFALRLHQRSAAEEAYKQVLRGVARHLAGTIRELEDESARLGGSADAAERTAKASRQASVERRDAEIAAVRGDAAHARQVSRHAYAAAVAACQSLTDGIAEVIEAAVAEAPDAFAAWSAVGELPPENAEPRGAACGLRLGDAAPAPLRASRLADGMPSLTAAGPRVWRLGEGRSLLFTDRGDAPLAEGARTSAVLARLLHQLPPGRALLTLFDPLGLGRNFAPFLQLGDVSSQLIGGKVWSNAEQMRRKLKDLIEQVERITQSHLRDEFKDIETYNANEAKVPEPYRFLVIEDFPEAWDEDTTRDLLRVLQNGPRCGVYVIAHANLGADWPRGVDLDALRPYFLEVSRCDGSPLYEVMGPGGARTAPQLLVPDPPPDPPLLAEIVARYGRNAQAALDVKVPYGRLLQLAGDGEGMWQGSSAEGISVPLGPSGRSVQRIKLGYSSGLSHHALLVGRPGSGKSNLLHVFINAAVRMYAPSELQLYLIDFKQGVEFKPYADHKLPHAHVIAVQSEREFGLSVLQGLEATMAARGALFAEAGVNSLASYRAATGEPMPRIVLVVDEFQEFFVRDDRIKREAATVMARLVSQGRYAGIHLVFGTQSLATATLDRPIRDQMTVRIALQCSEADSRLILADDNTAARLLTRPGEAIYNSEAGRPEGNSPFQVALFSEEERDQELAEVLRTAEAAGWAGEPPIVFEGHAPGDIEACRPLLKAEPPEGATPSKLRLWLGDSTSLKPVQAPMLTREAGRNLLVLTRDEAEGVGVTMAALLSLGVQCPPDAAEFRILDLTNVEAEWADHPEEFAERMPHPVQVLGRHQARDSLAELQAEVRRRSTLEERRRADAEAQRAEAVRSRAAGPRGSRAPAAPIGEPPIFLVILGLHRVRELRTEGGTSHRGMSMTDAPTVDARAALLHILREGPEVGVHTLIWCDAYSSLERALDRNGLNEIAIKVSGPVSDQESRRMFDDESAALLDKPHRMVLADDAQVGVAQVVRPYGVPSYDFIERIAATVAAVEPTVAEHA